MELIVHFIETGEYFIQEGKDECQGADITFKGDDDRRIKTIQSETPDKLQRKDLCS